MSPAPVGDETLATSGSRAPARRDPASAERLDTKITTEQQPPEDEKEPTDTPPSDPTPPAGDDEDDSEDGDKE